jgi:hypothetical protein
MPPVKQVTQVEGESMRIAVLGGGPGGLFAAALAKSADPSREVTVFERNRAEDTFGFGVVFSDATLAGIHAADPVLRTALTEHGVHWDPIEVRLHGERLLCHGNGMAAVERKTLLSLMQRRAIEAGVDVRFSTEAGPTSCWPPATTWSSARTAPTRGCASGLPTSSGPASRRPPPNSSGSARPTRSMG